MHDSDLSVLVVEDNPLDAHMIRELCRGSGLQLSFAGNLAGGIEALVSGRVDAALLDLHLPDVDGVDGLRRFRESVPDLAIVVLTECDDDSLGERAMELGAQDYLEKGSIDRRLIVQTLRYAVARNLSALELRRSEQKLRHAQRLKALGQLAGGIAHDFNNLLTVIIGQAEYLGGELGGCEAHRKATRRITAAATQAAQLTRQLLAFGRRKVGSPRVFDLNGLLRDVDRMLGRVIGENVHLECEISKVEARVEADPGQIEECLLIMAVNAREAMDGSGRLLVSSEIVDRAESILDEGEAGTGPWVRVRVEDDGRGMDEETLARAFEPFFSTKARSRGSGLGLASVYGTVRQAGGLVGVHSSPGEGTTFSLYFPLVEVSASVEVTPARVAPEAAARRVLLVEDDDEVRAVAVEALRGGGYRVDAMPDAEAAMSRFREDDRYDIVISDVLLPRRNGTELVEWMVARKPELRALFVSGFAGDLSDQHLGVLRRHTFLEKPFGAEELLAAVSRLGGGSDPRAQVRGPGLA